VEKPLSKLQKRSGKARDHRGTHSKHQKNNTVRLKNDPALTAHLWASYWIWVISFWSYFRLGGRDRFAARCDYAHSLPDSRENWKNPESGEWRDDKKAKEVLLERQ